MPAKYSRWDQDKLVRQFAGKSLSDFFRTELYFFNLIGRETKSILDVGCASGRLYELAKSFNPDIEFEGVDVSEKHILSARELYPHCNFQIANGINLQSARTFELVNATGVIQHEASYCDLIEAMFRLSERYVLFDAKFSALGNECTDIERSFSQSEGERVPYNILRIGRMVDYLMKTFSLKRLEIFGYETKLNSVTTIPDGLGPIYSAGVLCEKGIQDGTPPRIEIKIERS